MMILRSEQFAIFVILMSMSIGFAWIPTNKKSLGSYSNLSSTSSSSSRSSSSSSLGAVKSDDGVSIDRYHITTKTNKELIFDEKKGRFFETSIRPGSFHQAWQEFLTEEDPTKSREISSDLKNEMIPTRSLTRTSSTRFEVDVETNPDEECLIHMPYQDTCLIPLDASGNEDEDNNSREVFTPSIVQECYDAWNKRDMNGVVNCFDDSFQYQDGQYLGKIGNKQELLQHFTRQIDLLPPKSRLVVDHIAEDTINGNIAAQFHIERSDGSTVPFTKGVSFYTTKNGRITSGFRVLEMLVKPSKNSVSGMISLIPTLSGNDSTGSTTTPSIESKNSIIEEYFEAWNKRDMEKALSCFVEDCIYQTEDPVFVGTFVGKTALREHLTKNAAVLPSSCQIILDSIAVDKRNGNIGTKWHLEVNGVGIPNLRGCSMYTTDPATGLLTSGFDVTEAPVKLPKTSLPFLWAPAVALFDLS